MDTMDIMETLSGYISEASRHNDGREATRAVVDILTTRAKVACYAPCAVNLSVAASFSDIILDHSSIPPERAVELLTYGLTYLRTKTRQSASDKFYWEA